MCGSNSLFRGIGVEFDIFKDPAELVGKLEADADIAVFVDLDMIHQFHKNIAGQTVDVLILHKRYQRRVFFPHAVRQLSPFRRQIFQYGADGNGLALIIGAFI